MSDWIEWNGGQCPVKKINEIVEVKTRGGDKGRSFAKTLFWGHSGLPSDIIAYRIIGEKPSAPDTANHPPHYTSHPSGIECIQVTEHMGFNLGNAVTYIWRADLKGNAIEDLEKAAWYIQREIERRKRHE